MLATLWFNVAHYALRPWPWILTALATIVLYPDLADKEAGYIKALMDPDVFPDLAARLHDRRVRGRVHVDDRHAAQLGRIVRDQRFLPPLSRARRQRAALRDRLASLPRCCSWSCRSIVTFYLTSIDYAWKLLMVTGAGTGTVLLLRWFWWRINAWSEISAMVVAAAVSLVLAIQVRAAMEQRRPQAVRVPDADDRRHHDGRLAGRHVAHAARAARKTGRVLSPRAAGRPAGSRSPRWPATSSPSESLATQFVNWILGCVLIYTTLFGIGKLIFKEWYEGTGVHRRRPSIAAALISRNLSQPIGHEARTRANT